MARQVEDSDFELLTRVKTLGISADEIVRRVQRADELERLASVGAAATAAGLNAGTLAPLLLQFGLELEMRPVRVEAAGKTATLQIAHVHKRGDAAGGWAPLREFVETAGSVLHPFAPSLIAGPAPAGDATSTSTSESSSALDKVLDARKAGAAVKNPLHPAAT